MRCRSQDLLRSKCYLQRLITVSKKELALGQADEKIALEADKNIPTLRRRNPKDSIVLLWSWHYCRLYHRICLISCDPAIGLVPFQSNPGCLAGIPLPLPARLSQISSRLFSPAFDKDYSPHPPPFSCINPQQAGLKHGKKQAPSLHSPKTGITPEIFRKLKRYVCPACTECGWRSLLTFFFLCFSQYFQGGQPGQFDEFTFSCHYPGHHH